MWNSSLQEMISVKAYIPHLFENNAFLQNCFKNQVIEKNPSIKWLGEIRHIIPS